ncbi:carbohydrate ABC transporter permease [Paenibacillus sp. OV219]|uniref:carbohydrate ABC transporter permease n=1 Tax=Paenibacillus sp. OV219 TaxID=1884377 RepID=UPI0008AF955C|nr:sugar ABC transporter permease [Paenibacillus sp. OV219]SEN05671.1 carbohydrate ABC transporter membrane protein 1, CUT1 family [Paenibacillus sp. OV219]
MYKYNKLWVYLFIVPTLLVFLTFYFVPILTVFTTGFTEWNGFNAPKLVGFDNYKMIFTDDNSLTVSLINLFKWSIIAAFIHVPFGALVAFIIFKRPVGWRFVRGVFMIPNVIAVSAWAIIYRFIFNDQMGLLNNFIRKLGFSNFHTNWFFDTQYAFSAISLTWVFYAVIVTLLVLSDLMAIPKELHEAAKIDGATEAQIHWRINLPLIRGSLGTSVILSVIARITMFEAIFLTTKGGPGNSTYNISVMLYDGIINYQFGYANAVATIMIILGIGVLAITTKVFRMNKSVYN